MKMPKENQEMIPKLFIITDHCHSVGLLIPISWIRGLECQSGEKLGAD